MPSLTLSRRAKMAIWVVVVLIVLVIALAQLTGVYINWLWFKSLGYRHVYTTIFWTRVSLFFIFGLLMALILAGNLVIAYRMRPPFRPMSPEQQNIERYRVMLEPRRWLVLGGVAGISLLAAGLSAQGNWQTWQTWLNGTSFGQRDPQFHKDISFFAWDYPAYRLMLGFGFTAVIFAILLSLVVHYLCGSIRVQTPGPKLTLAARRHLTVLVFVFVVLKAIAYWLDRYGFVFSQRSKFTGASYTDVHAALPARTILFWIALVIAAGLIASLWFNSTLLPGIAFISMLVISILISGIYPAILQSVSVKPNASTKEVPYIDRNLAATRAAYGITLKADSGPNGKVDMIPFGSAKTPDAAALQTTDSATLNNVRILDPNVVSPDFLQFQQDGNVFGFPQKLDVDRYGQGAAEHDYVVGVRELDESKLTGNIGNWINKFTNYTHGVGFVAAAAASDITNNGNQAGTFASGDIPPVGNIGSLIKHPEVYYGELMPEYSIVGAKGTPQEFNGNGKPKISYQGGGGVSLSSLFTRLAFAVKYKQANFVLNDAASASGAKIIFNRDPRAAVRKVAPFLKVDGDPYPIVDSATGDIVWMVDGYTTLNNYPYSERQSLSSLTTDSLATGNETAKQPNDSINYIRNSVKATVDAYTGKVTLYQWDNTDPVLKTWTKVFPGLIKPKSSMPGDVLAHVRYPEDLFKVQRAMLGQYHVTKAVTFYNVSDKWTVPNDPTPNASGALPPYYVLAAPTGTPSGTQSVFQLTSPMNVNGRAYMAAYISVNSDPDEYGKITVLQLPRGSSDTPGPDQFYLNVAANGVITKDLSLFNAAGGGSVVIHGNLLTLPLGDSFVYVEPLYTQSSSGSGFPKLQRVIVAYGDIDNIGYGKTFGDAISDFLPGHCTGQTLYGAASCSATSGGSGGVTTPTGTPTSTPSSTPTSTPTSTPSGIPITVQQLNTAYAALQNAYKTGNPTTIATAEAQVLSLLQKYLAQNPGAGLPSGGSSAPSSPTPTK